LEISVPLFFVKEAAADAIILMIAIPSSGRAGLRSYSLFVARRKLFLL
jgi:hypothetical protein